MWQGKRPERIGQPTWLWKSEDMETGTNDPTILQPGNGKSTFYRDKCHFAKLLILLSLLFSEKLHPLFATFKLPSLAIPCRKRPQQPRPQQCLPWTLQLASAETICLFIMVMVSQREREREIISICKYRYIHTYINR